MNEDINDDQFAENAIRSYALKQQISAMHKKIVPGMQKPAPVRRMNINAMRVAAGIIFIILCSAFYLFVSTTERGMYNSHYVPYHAAAERGENTNNPPAKEYYLEGQSDLQNNNAARAVISFNKSLEANRKSGTQILKDDAEYYLALSYLKSGEVSKAIPIFKNIHDNKNHLYNSQVSEWFIFRLKILSWKQ